MGQHVGTTMKRVQDSRRGQTWHEIWMQQVRGNLRQATTRVTRGGGTKPPEPEGTTPLERDDRPIDQSR
jgi:hypothetical protein